MWFSNICAEFLRVLERHVKKPHGLHLDYQQIFHVLIIVEKAKGFLIMLEESQINIFWKTP